MFTSCADVTVAMTEGQMSVTEGEMVMVCVTLTGQLGRSVVVGLTSTFGTGKVIGCNVILHMISFH